MEKRYRALRTIAAVIKVLGWAILVLGILSGCVTSGSMVLAGPGLILGPGPRAGSEFTLIWIIMALAAFIGVLVTVGLYALILIAVSEGINVFLDIEENTGKMVRRLEQMGGSASPAPPMH